MTAVVWSSMLSIVFADGTNLCDGNPCQHLCLLSTNDAGFSCACPLNYTLNSDGQTCTCTYTYYVYTLLFLYAFMWAH